MKNFLIFKVRWKWIAVYNWKWLLSVILDIEIRLLLMLKQNAVLFFLIMTCTSMRYHQWDTPLGTMGYPPIHINASLNVNPCWVTNKKATRDHRFRRSFSLKRIHLISFIYSSISSTTLKYIRTIQRTTSVPGPAVEPCSLVKRCL